MAMPSTNVSATPAVDNGLLAASKIEVQQPSRPSPGQPMTTSQKVMNLALAAVSCASAQTCVQPCETAMVRQQLLSRAAAEGQATTFAGMLRQIFATEGLRGLYRGIEASMLREMSYSTLRFGLYEPLRDSLHDTPAANAALLGDDWANTVRVVKRAGAGMAAGGMASALASPTDLIKVRAQSDMTIPVPPLMHYVRNIAAQPGGPIMPFYEGVSATIARAVVLGATKMVTYNEVKDALQRSPSKPNPQQQPAAWQLLVPGGIAHSWQDGPALVFVTSVAAGLAITITTSPITNARTHIMANPGKFSSLPSALFHVGRTYGPFGYFRGFAAQWARFGPYATVQFVCWEQLRKWTGLPGI